jgi:ATP synthase protein I
MTIPNDDEPFVRELERQAQRIAQARRSGFWHGLATVGAVGWMVALPTVAGALVGRWLDERFASGILWTLGLLTLGVSLGSVSAWRHVRKELET